jgi:hypothetical protein
MRLARYWAVYATRTSLPTWSITLPSMCSICRRTRSRLHRHRKVGETMQQRSSKPPVNSLTVIQTQIVMPAQAGIPALA